MLGDGVCQSVFALHVGIDLNNNTLKVYNYLEWATVNKSINRYWPCAASVMTSLVIWCTGFVLYLMSSFVTTYSDLCCDAVCSKVPIYKDEFKNSIAYLFQLHVQRLFHTRTWKMMPM